MATKKTKPTFTFRVMLNSRGGSGPLEIAIVGESMIVNHRGDLEIMEGLGQYGNPACLAAFRSGTWYQALRSDHPTEGLS